MSSIGQLLRDRREALHLRPDEIAAQAHVPEDVLVALESGQGNISAAALDRLADVLAVDRAALCDGRIERRPTGSLFFFHQASFPDFRDLEDRPKVAEALARALSLIELGRILGCGPSLRSAFEPEGPTPEAAHDGYRLANRVRAALGNEVGAMPDMAELLEDRFDIIVRFEPLVSKSVAALTVKENVRGAAAVILNARAERRSNPITTRVDLAHELCHVLFDRVGDEVDLVIDDERDDDRSRRVRDDMASPRELSERRARAFAAELLMPAEGLRALLGKPAYEMSQTAAVELVTRARTHFVTPIEIAANHLTNREYIATWLRESLIDWARREEPRRAGEPPLAPIMRADLLDRRVLAALNGDIITSERARELLGLSPWDPLPTRA